MSLATRRYTLTNSEDGRESIVEEDRLAADRVQCIENGVDLDRFPPCPRQTPGGPRCALGAVANLRPVKNIDGLIRVAADFVARSAGPVRGRWRKATAVRSRKTDPSAGLDEPFTLAARSRTYRRLSRPRCGGPLLSFGVDVERTAGVHGRRTSDRGD